MASIRRMLAQYHIAPSKGLGQSFLADQAVMHAIVAAAELTSDQTVLEIGPGLGLLTRQLAESAGLVVAVELDSRMVEVLNQELSDLPNLQLLQGDILEIDYVSELATATGREEAQLGYLVVANLPYYITSQAIRRLLEARVPPSRMVLMVQREVAERIVAQPGEMSLLALSVQIYGEARIVRKVPASAFHPRPKVDSAVLRVDLYEEPLVSELVRETVFRIARAAFGQRRKQIHNSLAANLGMSSDLVQATLHDCDIDQRRRPQSLSIDEWIKLAGAFGP
ncbi:MAG: 16S rRNA (adenine(1518)-N(6)/adenine(1519)-N(6))-dimethyltransferase RsmA [Anaerolineae bacterium]|jgi:16S rRNA (adenine1518-N6/adenine1519-N6)-dimethyltransferase